MSSSDTYHYAVSQLSWLFGSWEAIEAEVSYPTMDTLKYGELLEFQPAYLQPLIQYKSETWHPLKKQNLHIEVGFLKVDPDTQTVALLGAHNFGMTEVSEGVVKEHTLTLESKSVCRTSFTKLASVVKLVRTLSLVNEELHSLMLMETVNQPLQKHLECRYKRKLS
ncbi:THAP domain-containing protein 4, partial [Stegodyphus mimosarum]